MILVAHRIFAFELFNMFGGTAARSCLRIYISIYFIWRKYIFIKDTVLDFLGPRGLSQFLLAQNPFSSYDFRPILLKLTVAR